MKQLYEIEASLTAPGGPFETVEEMVRGERMRVFRARPGSLREYLARSVAFGSGEYLVSEQRRISFAEHLDLVGSVARGMHERYGIGHGDRVAILGANALEWVVAYWATVSLGAVAVALNGWWARDEILYGLEDSEPKLLIGDRKRLERLDGHALAQPVVEFESGFAELEGYAPGAGLPEHPIDEDDAATILYTSGTTGRPKGAINSHRGILACIQFQMFHGVRMMLFAASQGVKPDPDAAPNCFLINAPLFHVSGLYTGTLTALTTGMKTVWPIGRFDPVAVMRLIEREKVTSWGPMGSMLHRMAAHPEFGRYDLSSVRNIGSGGAPVSRELREKMATMFPNARTAMGLGYGMTETTSLVSATFAAELAEFGDSVGRAMPTLEVQIRDAEGRVLPEGEEGEICVRGPSVMPGYWRNPEATREAFLPGAWLRSGDIGRLVQGYIHINSRKRDLILRGAENVYPAEIEQCLEAHPEVAEAAVLGVDHPELGQEVKAFVVPSAGAEPAPEALASWTRERLAYFKVPAHWELRSEPMPRNAAGKVLKHVLRGEENPFVEE